MGKDEVNPAPNMDAHEEYDNFNDRDLSMSTHLLPSRLGGTQGSQPPVQKATTTLENSLSQSQNRESQKSFERVMSSASRNAQVMTPSITGKSPLLLQKKQQMVI